ncbi:DUF2652 domain-containing protein [Aquimarina hainanensis]|uniref:DUF2652 domain-containing protein n=1 Tax=Aquimarina hainanensis TaxID=1578017 RepID=A0ABW5N5D8_9FLAO
MDKSLLFLPDISGFTEFVQTTEARHSEHVIAELLEVLIEANMLDLELAEIEGDALFFYKENEVPDAETLFAQVERMFTDFYSHLEVLKKNRICPCQACSLAPNLQLKIVIHSGVLQFINVKGKRKPFGNQVIEVHRLLKNDVPHDQYVLLSSSLADSIAVSEGFKNKLFTFYKGANEYDGKVLPYLYSEIEKEDLQLIPFSKGRTVNFDVSPSFVIKQQYPISATQLLEYITNYSYRHYWTEGVDKVTYNEEEVTRLGTEHVCVINGKHFDFTTVVKEGEPGQLVYGEYTTSLPPVDELYQFFVITPVTEQSCILELEVYIATKSWIKKMVLFLLVKKEIKKSGKQALHSLHEFVVSNSNAR